MKPKCIDLFSGCGGLTLGLAMAGYDVVGHVEWDKCAVETYELNKNNGGFPNSELIGKDITAISDETIIEFGKKHGHISLIAGGPPCQSFSMAGRREIGDPRDNLFLHFVRFVNLLQPDNFLLENVPGLLTKKSPEGEFMIDVIISAFKMVGYNVEYALHNAADYGVPQFRRRIFFYGMRKDINKPILFPLPTHFGKEGDKDSQLHRCVQCQKLYASYTFNKNREIVCLFCDHHNKNEEVSHDEQPIEANWIVIPQKVMVPAPIETMMMVGFFEKRTSIKGTTRFLYCWKHDGSVEWFKSSEVRKVVDNDKECDAAEAFIMNRMVIQPIKNVLLGCDADELNDEGGENDEDGII